MNLDFSKKVFKNQFSKLSKELLIPILVYLCFNIFFVSVLPYLDGNIDFIKAADLHTGGMAKLATNWPSLHPPIKAVLGSLFMSIFGVNQLSVTWLGILHGVIGLTGMYFLGKKLFGNKVAFIATLVLAVYPLYNASGTFALIDFMVAAYLLAALAAYVYNKKALLILFLSLGSLTKETFLILPVIIILVELLPSLKSFLKTKHISLKSPHLIVGLLIPLFLFWSWTKVLQSYGTGIWSDWIFADTASKGGFYTIVNNLVTLGFINSYAMHEWLETLVLNFNWVLVLTTLSGVLVYSWTAERAKKVSLLSDFRKYNLRGKTFSIVILYALIYFLCVLSFQTFTIPRYGLPFLVLMLIFFAKSLSVILNQFQKLRLPVLIFFVCLFSLMLFRSADPISINLWGLENALGQDVYALNLHGAGTDGLTYNLQFDIIAGARSKAITDADKLGLPVFSDGCFWIFADKSNEIKMLDYLNMNRIPRKNLCNN